ncbi:Gfo/Idh/MocA family oxidoreductase [Phenylobacterium deserti]|uniref:Oxidoreductase n=1 Tax=Phenylobacterium deserti TaxID=1914756 RepID=A0A328AQ09_9CAUL|nr:Gfo/Idh/MocA family oxidoreductase [Phenylobacterium deserti]RAK57112.1 oxidoreductase [Phenylobacterium deserti]
MSNDPIRVGLIGHGLAGGIIHAPLIEAAGDFRITAVATSRDISARRDRPRRGDPADVVQADDVDLVVVASPNETHVPLATAALQAGKHVVLDKPFALSVADADALIALAAENRRVLTIFHNRREDGDFRAVREKIASGALGEVGLFEARWDRFRPEAAPAWRNSTQPGSGMLWDLGPHLIDQVLQLFGSPDWMRADRATQRDGAVADDYFELTFAYGRMRAIVSSCSVVAAPRPRFSAHGTKASLLTHGIDPIEALLRQGGHPADADFRERLPAIPATLATPNGQELLDIAAGDWVDFYRKTAAAVRGEGPPPVEASEAREVIAMIEQAFAQVRG